MPDGKLDLPQEIKRTNYFTSQFLVEADFRDEQAYHLQMRRLHNRALHVWGVVDGLTVSKTGAQEVTVSEGMAIDSGGKEIVLPSPQKINVPLDKSGDLFVVISYRQDNQNSDYVYTGTGLTDTKYTRAVEGAQVEIKESAPDDGSMIKLARLKVDQNVLADNLNNGIRRLAGSVMRRGSGTEDLYIGADGNVGIGTTSPRHLLTIENKTAPAMMRLQSTVDGGNYGLLFNSGKGGASIATVQPLHIQSTTASITLNTGKVGIGINNPTENLDVRSASADAAANVKVANSDATNFVTLYPGRTSDPAAAITWKTNTPLRFATADSVEIGVVSAFAERMRITGGGNVGIGTPSPATPLHVTSGFAKTDAAARDVATFSSNEVTNPLGLKIQVKGSTDADAAKRYGSLQVKEGGQNRHLILQADGGNVGIGVKNPGFTLQVGDHESESVGVICVAGKRGNFWRRWTLRTGDGNTNFETNKLRIRDEDATADRLIIDESGRVGIGTTAPNSSLVIRKDVSSQLGPTLTLYNGGGAGGAAAAIDFRTYASDGKVASASIHAIDDNNASNHLLFYTKSPGSADNELKERLRIASGGNVGVGATNPTQAKLVVNGGVNAIPVEGATAISYFSEQDGPGRINRTTAQNAFSRTFIGQTVSIYATDNIWSGYSFVSSSDERLKNIEARSDGATDLRTLLDIEITDYRYKDVSGRGDGAHKKVVGQQVERVFPQAVSRHTDVVPDIYRRASMRDGWVALATDLKRGERVKLITETGEAGVYEVLEVTPDEFRVDFECEAEKVFVFGREVDDFLTVDYDAIAMLNVSATQQLKKETDEEAQALRAESAALKARLDAIESALAKLLPSGAARLTLQ